MKQTYCVMISIGLLMSLAVLTVGCQEAETDATVIRRARLVANENLDLKRQIEAKDRQIAQLEQTIETLEKEKEQITEQSGHTALRLLQMTADANQKAEQLQQENARLKEQLQGL